MREPIRKPKYKYKKLVDRHRVNARRLGAKLLRIDRRIYLVQPAAMFSNLLGDDIRGKPNLLPVLYKNLRQQCVIIDPLSPRLLNDCHHALKMWIAISKSRKQNMSLDEAIEVSHLQNRLAQLGQIKKMEQQESDWILARDEQQMLNQRLQSQRFQFRAKGFQNAEDITRIAQYCRIVFWFRGIDGAQEFIDSLPVADASLQRESAQKKTMEWLKTIRLRMNYEGHRDLWMEIRQTVTQKLEQSSQELLALPKRFRRKPLENFINTRLDTLERANALSIHNRKQLVPAILTVWIATNHTRSQVPQELVQQIHDADSIRKQLRDHAFHLNLFSSHKFYPLLKRWLENKSQVPEANQYGCVLSMLANNESFDVIDWVLEVGIYRHLYEIKSLGRFRQIVEPLGQMVCEPATSSTQQIRYLVDSSLDESELQLLEMVLRWVRCFDREIFTRGLRRQLRCVVDDLQSLMETIRRTPFQSVLLESMNEWSDKSQAIIQSVDDEVEIPKRARIWIRRLSYFQRVQSKQFRIPKSISRHLDRRQKMHQEERHLQEQIALGRANQKMIARFEYLQRLKPYDPCGDSQLYRSAQESVFVTGLEALKQILSNIAGDYWKSLIGPMPEQWSTSQILTRVDWITRMNSRQKLYLSRCIEHWRNFQSDMKQELTENKDWIVRARTRRVQTEPWFSKFQKQIDIDGHPFLIELVKNPFEIFQMGELFNTCLSPSGCYEMSVLSNAIDANKQVVFVRNARQQVVGRKLLAITTDFKLSGFNVYTNLQDLRTLTKQLGVAIRQYCCDLANEMNVAMTDCGNVTSICGLNWYDDGMEEWTE